MVIVSIANIATINITIAIDAIINMLYTFRKGKRKVTTLEFRIPELIKNYLEKNELTQREFAKITGIDAAALSRLINSNQKQIDIRTLEKLHGHIPLDYGNLVTVVEDDEPAPTEPAQSDSPDNQRTKRNSKRGA